LVFVLMVLPSQYADLKEATALMDDGFITIEEFAVLKADLLSAGMPHASFAAFSFVVKELKEYIAQGMLDADEFVSEKAKHLQPFRTRTGIQPATLAPSPPAPAASPAAPTAPAPAAPAPCSI
jgi:hypothetical protein